MKITKRALVSKSVAALGACLCVGLLGGCPASGPRDAGGAIVRVDPSRYAAPTELRLTASQEAGVVTLRAAGINRSSGFTTRLVRSAQAAFPPEWILQNEAPRGAAAQVLTPFDASATFRSEDPVDAVIVSLGVERRTVPVQR
ncbi:MAG: hypothetical protein C0475_07295 [Planctomyces sp.]|nr:hypothetical protein [Planctomyces sp.]MBA4039279.1 hypothetical protein [Planctomyces sp.]MBA4120025.1 hypothetical protein [Isosphaera sp.]